jgi:aminoglycoside 6'-N-acetyltransferase
VSGDELHFRPLTAEDLPQLQRWLREPHVDRWWHGPQDLAGVYAKYIPRIDGREPTFTFVIELAGMPIGFIQWARWADYPDHAVQLGAGTDSAGVDLAIGELDRIGHGIGPRVLRAFLDRIVFADPAIVACITDPQTANTRSLRAFTKAGFTHTHTVQLTAEPYPRAVMRLDKKAASTRLRD